MVRNRVMKLLITIIFISISTFFVTAQNKSSINNSITCNNKSFDNKTDTIFKRKWIIYKTYDEIGNLIKIVKIKHLVSTESANDMIKIIKEYDEKGKLIHRERKKSKLRINM